jgi:hypothetical protein
MKKFLIVAFVSFISTTTTLAADATAVVQPVDTKNQIISSVEPSYEQSWNVRVVDDIYRGDKIDFYVAPTFLEEFGNIQIDWDYSVTRLACEQVTAKHLSCTVKTEFPGIVTARFIVADRDGIPQYTLKSDTIRVVPQYSSSRWLRDRFVRAPWFR